MKGYKNPNKNSNTNNNAPKIVENSISFLIKFFIIILKIFVNNFRFKKKNKSLELLIISILALIIHR